MEIELASQQVADQTPGDSPRSSVHRTKKYPKKFVTPYNRRPRIFKKILTKLVDSNCWKFVFIISILLNFVHVSYNYVFIRAPIAKLSYLMMIVCDSVYILNYFFLNCAHNFNSTGRKSMKMGIGQIIDFFLLLPYSYIYEAVYHNSNSVAFFILRTISFFRLFHFIVYTPKGINFVLKYLLLIYFLHHTIACVYFIQYCPIGLYLTNDSCNNSNFWIFNGTNTYNFPVTAKYYIHSLFYGVMFIANSNMGQSTHLYRVSVAFGKLLSFFLIYGPFLTIFSLKLMHKLQERFKRYNNQYSNLLNFPSTTLKNFNLNINRYFFQHSLAFRTSPKQFIEDVACLVRHETFQCDELIFRRGIIKDKMIVIEDGAVEILSDEDDQSCMVVLGPGSCLGEISLILTLPAKSSVRAACCTHLRVLHRKDFLQIIHLHPDAYKKFYENLIERVLKARQAQIQDEANEKTAVATIFGNQDNKPKSAINKFKQMVEGKSLIDYADDKYIENYKLLNSVEKPKLTLCLTTKFPWVFQPNTSLIWFWEMIILTCCFFVAIFYPYFISFERQFHSWMILTANFAEAFFIVDIFIILFTAIETSEHKIIKTVPSILFRRLADPCFYLDLISCLHFELLAPFMFSSATKHRFYYILKLNRLLKVYRICRFFHYFERKNIEFVFHVRLMKFVLYFTLISYWIACGLYLLSCFAKKCSLDGWYFMQNFQTKQNPLVVSWQFSVAILKRLSNTNIVLENLVEASIVYCLIIFGVFLTTYCCAQLISPLLLFNKRKYRFKRKLFQLQKILTLKKVQGSYFNRSKNYFKIQWQQQDNDKETDNNVLIELLSGISLFSGLNQNLIRLIAKHAKIILVPAQEVIVYEGEVHDFAYIIQDGFCVYKNFADFEAVLGPGAFFGNVAFLPKVVSLGMVVTKTDARVICLKQSVMAKLFSIFTTVQVYYKQALEASGLKEAIRKNRIDIPDRFEFDWQRRRKKNIINVFSYCRRRDEVYWKSWQQASLATPFQIILVPFCILPQSILLKCWLVTRAFIALAIFTLTPLQIFNLTNNNFTNKLIYFINFVTYFDLYLMMFIGYYGEKNQLIVHPVKTTMHYIKTRFVLDLIFCLPWNWLFRVNFKLVDALKMGQVYRVWHLLDYFSQDICRKKILLFLVLKLICLTFIIVIFSSVLILIVYCADDDDSKCYLLVKKAKFNDNNEKSWNLLLLSIYYFLITSMTGCHIHRNFLSTLNSVYILTIALAICGMLYFSYVYALIASYYANGWDLHTKTYQQLTHLKQFMDEENVNVALKKLIVTHIETVWLKDATNLFHSTTVDKVHPTFYKDLIFAIYGEQILSEIPIFSDVHLGFFRLLATELRVIYFARGEIVCQSENVMSHIYIVCKGQVEIIKLNGMQTIVYAGGMFGNITPMPKNKISDTCLALTDLECLCIENEAFFYLVKKYPSLHSKLKEILPVDCDYVKAKETMVNLRIEERSKTIPDLAAYSGYTNATNKSCTSISLSQIETNSEWNCLNCILLFFPWKWCHVTISPYSVLCRFIDCICLIFALINCFLATFHFAFQYHTNLMFALTIGIDTIFYMKICMDFHRAYENKFGELVLSNRQIMKHFLKTERILLLMQLIGNSPLHFFTLAIDDGFYYSCLRLMTILKMVYIYQFYKRKSTKILQSKLLMIFWSFFMLALFIHLLACCWFLLSCQFSKECKAEFWLQRFQQQNYNKLDLYLVDICFIISLFTFTSPVQIFNSFNNIEKAFIIFAFILITFSIGLFIGQMICIYNLVNNAHEENRTMFRNDKKYLRRERVKRKLFRKFKMRAKCFFKEVGRRQIIPELVYKLPYDLKCELMMEIYGSLLENSYIFSEAEETFVRQLASFVKVKIYLPGDFVIRHGDSDQTMYFIHSGEIEILTVHEDRSVIIHEILYADDMFGLIQGLFYNIPHQFSFRARSVAYIVSLSFCDWEDLLKYFPHTKNVIYAKANDMYCNI